MERQTMRIAALVLGLSLCGALADGGEVVFSAKPAAARDGDKVKISFAVAAPTDAEVTVLDAKGEPVRHLAAGLLGKNAPEPFKKDALAQELLWDGRDDQGKPAAGGPFKVRVRLGLGAELDRFIPGQASPLGPPTAIGVGPDGTVYVLSSRDKAGGASIYALDREGKYLRTILPSPAGLKKEQVRGLERLKLDDGSEVPIVYSAYIADLAPHLAGVRPQQLAVSKDGWIVFASGGNNWTDQIVPRHALVIKPDGTTPPEVGFVGPPLGPYGRYSIGLRTQQIALSPDGKTLYFAGMGQGGKSPKGIHTIGRLKWDSKEPEPFIGKPDEPGNDEAHLNDPTSVATDDKGNIYVVDSGNGRVAGFDPQGKFLGETKVSNPGYICVNSKSGALYVGSSAQPLTGKHEPAKPYSIIKFDKAVGGKEVARYDFNNYRYAPLLALDAGAEPPRLWLSYAPAYGSPAPLMPLTDKDGKLSAGQNVLAGQERGFTGPLFMSLDPGRERLYVGDFSRKVLKVDLKTDKISDCLPASEVAVDRDGNLYALSGYGTNALLRFDPDGKPLAFQATGSNKIEVPYRAGLPHVGVRGLTVTPGGDIYVFEEVLKPEQLHVFGPDGKPKKQSVIRDIPTDSANSVAVDRDGNIYIGVNVHDPKKLYPDELAAQVPPYGWERTYGKDSGWYGLPQRKAPGPPWDGMYLNNYLYHYGSVFKFGPEGGRFWTGGRPKEGENQRPEGVPADASEYRTALLGNVVWGSGAKWVHRGFGLVASRTEGSGDPTCSCYTSRFGMDEHGRLWVPDVFRFRVTALDSAGNELARFGAYGNVDSAGPKSLLPEPKIPLASPNAVVAGRDRVCVADRKSRRIVVVRLKFAAEESCELK